MKTEALWHPRSLAQARLIHDRLRKRLSIRPLEKRPQTVAGADAAFAGDRVLAVVCVFTFPDLEPVEEARATAPLTFPYIPGYLSFREGPALWEAARMLRGRPDLILFDGQGIAHPHRMGIASFMGIVLDIPSVGCAKSRLVGEAGEPGLRRGSLAPLLHKGERVGAVLRTRDGRRPLFVSPGHRTDIDDAVRLVLGCCRGFRIPEPLRKADSLCRAMKKALAGGGEA